MSTTVDSKVAELILDNRNFEKNATASIGTLDRLEKKLNLSGATKGLEGIDAASKKINFSALGNAVEAISVKFSALQVMGITALANITNSAVNAGKRITSALTIDPIKTGFSEYETQINAVQTILANTQSKGTSLGDVNSALDELNTYADKTIYNFTEMTRNIGTFTAAGVDLDKSVTSIKGIANLAAVSGSTSQQASTAMYQLSQALAAGRVSLMDWNSVVNAGMGGQLFQDALKRTAKNMGHNVDAMIEKYGSFRESLTQGEWLTADVLTETLTQLSGAYSKAELIQQGYTEEQANEIVKLADTAVNAATKVKTLTQLWDTLKESAQSGWTQTWEILVGDFEQSKELFTTISDTLGEMIGSSAESRNKLLEGAFGTSSANPFKDVTEETIKMSDAQLKASGYTEKQISQIRRLGTTAKQTGKPLSELIEKATRPTGRELVIESMWNAFNAVLDVIKPVKQAFRELFPPMTANRLYELIEGFNKFTAALRIGTDETGKLTAIQDKIRRTFKGLFAILDIGKQAFSGIFTAIKPLFGSLGSMGGGILDLTANIGDAIVKFNEFLKSGDAFGKIGRTIANAIIFVQDKIKSFISLLKEKVAIPALEGISALFERIGTRAESTQSAFDILKKGAVGAIKAIGEAFAKSDFLSFLQTLWNGIKTLGSGIAKAFGSIGSAFSNKLANADYDGFFDLVNTLIAGGIGIGITKFLKSVTDTFSGFGDILDGVVDVFDGLRGCFEAYQTQLKAGTLLKIAAAVAILAASLIALSFVDSAKLSSATGAITMLFADLVGSMALINKIGGFKGVGSMALTMIGLSLSVLILASALKKLGGLDWEELGKGLLGVVALTGTMVGAVALLRKAGGKAVKGAVQMVIFAAAIKILASACKDLSTLSWDGLAKGLVGVGVLLAEVVGFLKFAKVDGKSMKTAVGIVILASAIKILASACSDFASMGWEEIGKGLAAVGVLLGEVVLFTRLTGNAKKVISSSVALVTIAAAMKIMVPVLKDLGSMEWESIGKGLSAVGGSLVAIAVASRIMPKNMIGISIGVLGIAAALTIISGVISDLGGMSVDAIKKSLVTLGGALVILSGAMLVMSMAGFGGAAGMIVAAAAIAILTPSLKALGSLSWDEIVRGLTTLAGAFTIIGIAGAVLAPLVPTILGLAAAFALIGVSVLTIGVGLVAAGAGLSAMAIGFTALGTSLAGAATAITAGLTVIIMGIVSLIPAIIAEIGKGIITLCDVIIAAAPAIGGAVKAIILSLVDVLVTCIPVIADGALKLVIGILDALVTYTPQIVDLLFAFVIGLLDGLASHMPDLIKSGLNLVMSLFTGIVEAIKGLDTSGLLEGIAGVGIIAGLMAALSAVAGLVPGAMLGVLGVGAVIAEIAIVLAAIGALAQIPGLDWLINEGGNLLQSIGTAIGKFVGGIVGGIAEGFTSSLPQIGTDLSQFIINATPFIVGVKMVDESVLAGAAALAGAIIALTAADLIAGIASFISGGSSLAQLGSDLSAFMINAAPFIAGAALLNADMMSGVKALADTVLILTAANVLEGLTSWLTGGSSLATFGEQLPMLGTHLNSFATNLGTFDESTVTTVKCASDAIKALAQAADSIPNEGGLWAKIAGENSIATFGSYFPELGSNLNAFATNLGTFDESTVSTVSCAANAIKTLAAAAKEIPNEGGLWASIVGDNSLASFGEDLGPLGTNIATFVNNLGTFDDAKVSTVNCAANAIKTLASAAKEIPNEGGLWASIVGDNSLATFGDHLASLGTNIATFAKNLGTFGQDKITTVKAGVSAVKAFATLADSDLKGAKKHIEGFGDNLGDFASDISSFVDNLPSGTDITAAVNGLKKIVDAVNDISSAKVAGFSDFAKSLKDIGTDGVDAFVNAFTSGAARSNVQRAAAELAERVVHGVKSRKPAIVKSFVDAVKDVPAALKKSRQSFYDAGSYLVSGFAAGISDNTYKAEAKAAAMAKAAAKAAEEALDINSPSKVLRAIGTSVPEGFAMGIEDLSGMVDSSAVRMTKNVVGTVRQSISRMADIISEGVDVQPTIRPVVDLTDVRRGVNAISGMMPLHQSVSVSRTLGSISATIDQRGQNGFGSEVVSAIGKLRRDISGISKPSYIINGVTYDDGSNVARAINEIARYAVIEGRV